MGLGSFRVRLTVAVIMLLVVWQSVRLWSSITGDPVYTDEVREIDDAPAAAAKPRARQKVLISVYYEALCPDSRSFVIKQLEPTVQRLEDNVQVEMVPYGKATTTHNDDDYEFTCQHGPIECEANIIHACAIDIIKDPELQLNFLACMIRNNLNPQNITKVCGEKLHVDVDPILNCNKDLKGKELLAKYGKMTDALRPPISFIPTITLDKNSDNQPAILKNLLEQVCRHFKVLPNGCT